MVSKMKAIRSLMRPLKNNLIYHLSPYSALGLSTNKRKLIVALAANYGNLGDKAITNAQELFLSTNFPDSEVIVVNVSDTYKYLKSIKKSLRPNDVITLLGGGNLGTIYPYIEEQRRLIIREFPKNRIVSFPQSVFFSQDAPGSKYLEETTSEYAKHKDLHLFARDKKTYDFMMEHFSNNIYLAPDIVLSQDYSESGISRNAGSVVLSLRTDSETSMGKSYTDSLAKSLTGRGWAVTIRDTELDAPRMSRQEGKMKVDEQLDLYRSAAAVVTDRLHGVIFCAITGTPCVALDNNNGKVHALCNYWLSDVKWIKTINDSSPDSINYALGDITKKDPSTIRPVKLDGYFGELLKTLGK